MTCRCSHPRWQHQQVTHGRGACGKCKCPEYRELETPDTQTLKGVQP